MKLSMLLSCHCLPLNQSKNSTATALILTSINSEHRTAVRDAATAPVLLILETHLVHTLTQTTTASKDVHRGHGNLGFSEGRKQASAQLVIVIDGP
jgi:hypothetical protein